MIERMNNSLKAYLDRATGGKSLRSIAAEVGMEQSTLSRQLSGEVKVQTVVEICRAFKLPMVEAFVAAGFITQDEAGSMEVESALRAATDRQLIMELLRRVDAKEAGPEITEPVDESVLDDSSTRGPR